MKFVFFLQSFFATATAFSGGSLSSKFSGTCLTFTTTTCNRPTTLRGQMDMKKGKANVPPHMRNQYKKTEKMNEMRSDYMAASENKGKGFPTFSLYVKDGDDGIWLPCGNFQGDERTKQLAKTWSDDGMMAGMAKGQLDKGVSGSLFQDLKKMKRGISQGFPQFKGREQYMKFGYKLGFEGLDEKRSSQMNEITPEEPKGIMDGITKMFGN
eukprot:CAMPEP_0118716848 /NCGR_PEP_ID=MMETSP0800-20121206/27758_1 /TAXON_ID=210618 ORGANISM="Striatella unipunctata, Strain CCMP2910" /NCGR_SAMPLE_ID=MMETSP0800 /ASSEMBLY_ACC=CAM_ASM_000638 /LENGTH=210 /DNA_ID=CAMNT_0006623373 /DNA_START=91 /DNA_END=723 /DNA_ORIENTATION=+